VPDAPGVGAAILRSDAAHRPWPLSEGPWIMAQTWHDLLFAHWPISPATMRVFLPGELELDTFDGTAWLGIVPFRMSGVRLRWTPPLPGFSAFPELNVRTYVRHGNKPGVWFFSLDAANPLAVAVARAWFHLPYFRARMSCRRDGEDVIYASVRRHAGARKAELAGRYGPRGEAFEARPGTLEHWLTERYGLYALSRHGELRSAEIHHPPWSLQPADAAFERNTMTDAAGIALPACAPVLLFARRQEVVVWTPRRIAARSR
jgi:uncharacterized protein